MQRRIMIGPPEACKTILARIPTILPGLSFEEAIEAAEDRRKVGSLWKTIALLYESWISKEYF